jgi:raffinose/stachyose/melibiose transport system substrate-binding protein
MRSRRVAQRLLALITVAVLAVACAPSTDGDSEAGGEDPTTLTVWSWRTEDQAVYDEIFAEYTAQHPGTEVEFKAFKNTEYNTILPAGLAEEGGPDVMQLRAYGQLQGIVEAGTAMALDDAVPELADFPEAALEGARGVSDGKTYGVPFALQTLHIYYNQESFDEHGITVPTTWEELIAAADTLEAAGVTPFATTGKDPWMLPIVHDVFAAPRYGGPDFADAVLSGQKDFTDPDYVASIDLLSELAGYFPDDVNGVAYTDSQVLFTNGQAAMFPGGAFELGFFQRQAPDLDIGVFSAPVPPGSPEGATPLVPGWSDGSWGVNPSSPNTDQAVELVRWMASPEFGQMFTDELKQISPIPGVEPSDPVLAEMQAAYSESPTPYLLLVHFRYGEPLGTDLMGQGLQNLLLGRADGQQVAEELQRGVGQWFQPES